MENQLVKIFSKQVVLSISELKGVLRTNSRMTIFRKLKQLPYKSSYSHCGRYYTLDNLAQYNENGIWGYNQVYFSRHGTLKNTVLECINSSKHGLASSELEGLLHVPVFNSVLDLYKTQKIDRKQIGKEYIYLSKESGGSQFHLRQEEIKSKNIVAVKDGTDKFLVLFMSLLNEKQQRLFAGYESLKHGYGGDKKIANQTGLNVKTVSQGRRELLNKDIDITRIRKAGAGRPSLKKTKKS